MTCAPEKLLQTLRDACNVTRMRVHARSTVSSLLHLHLCLCVTAQALPRCWRVMARTSRSSAASAPRHSAAARASCTQQGCRICAFRHLQHASGHGSAFLLRYTLLEATQLDTEIAQQICQVHALGAKPELTQLVQKGSRHAGKSAVAKSAAENVFAVLQLVGRQSYVPFKAEVAPRNHGQPASFRTRQRASAQTPCASAGARAGSA